jgi:hypothetical protein
VSGQRQTPFRHACKARSSCVIPSNDEDAEPSADRVPQGQHEQRFFGTLISFKRLLNRKNQGYNFAVEFNGNAAHFIAFHAANAGQWRKAEARKFNRLAG